MKNKYKVNNLYISNFKPFKISTPPMTIPFVNANGNTYQFMMLSGYNGYGKTTLFQAVEFILTGKIEIFQFKDTTKKYDDHILVNELGRESLLALELINETNNEYISIVRYNKNAKPCKENDMLKEDKSYELFLLDQKFIYEEFLEKYMKKDIDVSESKDIAEIFKEKDINEWLAANYLRQEQSSNILFKSNNERVNFVNSFIEMGFEEHFSKFQDEKTRIGTEINTLTEDIKELKKNISTKREQTVGEKPSDFRLFDSIELVWDKMKYDANEDFENYMIEIDQVILMIKKLDSFISTDKVNGIEILLSQPGLLKNIIIYNELRTEVDNFISQFVKKGYYLELSKDTDSIMTYKIENQYLDENITRKIKKLRENISIVEKNKGDNQKLFERVKKIRDDLNSDNVIISSLFGETCPLCGHDYTNEIQSLSEAIKEYEILFNSLDENLRDSSTKVQEDIDNQFKMIQEEMQAEINKIHVSKELYEYLIIIKQKPKEYNDYLRRLEYLLSGELDKFNFTDEVNNEIINNAFDVVKDVLESALTQHKKVISTNPLDENEQMILDEKKGVLAKLDRSENLIKKIEQKKAVLQWNYLNKQYMKYSKDIVAYDATYDLLKKLHIRNMKLSKLLTAVENAKKQYISDLIKFIEIPLYVYSGKLLQSHPNGLGVFCTTGRNDNNVTQFKLTTDSNVSGHDIVNKFSSGQKAVINISIILAFRKIRESCLDLFMIDDPCQSMDDINVASLTEILRNEFSNTQIIISTHDDSTAGYMCYKYIKSGIECRNLNIQKEFYTYNAE
jgi:exonuclease SbcC